MNRARTVKQLGGIGLSVILLTGCVKLGPDFTGIKNPPLPKAWKKSHASRDESIVEWWHTFHDPVLNTLISKAYAQNLDIKSAGLRIAQARAALGISQGLAFPCGFRPQSCHC